MLDGLKFRVVTSIMHVIWILLPRYCNGTYELFVVGLFMHLAVVVHGVCTIKGSGVQLRRMVLPNNQWNLIEAEAMLLLQRIG